MIYINYIILYQLTRLEYFEIDSIDYGISDTFPYKNIF